MINDRCLYLTAQYLVLIHQINLQRKEINPNPVELSGID
jgi:hypothetical protein